MSKYKIKKEITKLKAYNPIEFYIVEDLETSQALLYNKSTLIETFLNKEQALNHLKSHFYKVEQDNESK